jgi:hypothetical protein
VAGSESVRMPSSQYLLKYRQQGGELVTGSRSVTDFSSEVGEIVACGQGLFMVRAQQPLT